VYLNLRNAIPKIPFPVRRFLCAHAHWMPLFLMRGLLSLATCPLSADRKWIHPVASQETWKGIWINPFVKSAEQVEEIAPDQDLVILYFHGNTHYRQMLSLDTHHFLLRRWICYRKFRYVYDSF
jgi:hypothetical protein